MNKIETYTIITIVLALGFAGGHYHGKDAQHEKIVYTYQKIFNDKIECGLTINPITGKQLK